MTPYYTLFCDRIANTDTEAMETVPHLLPTARPRVVGRHIGGASCVQTGSTTWTFSRRADRDRAKDWLLGRLSAATVI